MKATGIFTVCICCQAAGPRAIVPRSSTVPRTETNRSSRDERRRASHNEGNSVISQILNV